MVHNLSVRARLGGAFGVLMLVLVLVSSLSLHALGESRARFASFVEQTSVRAALAAEVQRQVYDRAVAARNLVLVSDAADIALERAAVMAAHEATTRDLGELQKAVAAPSVGAQERQLVAAMVEVESRYGPVALDIVQKALAGQRDAAILRMNTECRPLLAELVKAVGAYMAQVAQQGAAEVREAEAAYTLRWRFLAAICVLSCGVAVLLAWRITRSLTRALGAEPAMLKAAAQRVAAGYLGEVADAPATVQGSVMASLEDMRGSLVGLVGQVRHASDAIASGSTEIATGNSDLSQRTEEQAANLEQTAASMEQMHSSVGHNAEKARLATELAGAASVAASRGGVVMGDVVATMEGISASARRITDIIGVIDGIAFQTNILALNAAVEAARAGEQGRGFAVVAGEVRGLARRSAEAAREIKALIGSSDEKIRAGSRLVSDAGVAMDDIVTQVQRVAGLIEEIRAATAEQTGGIGEVNAAVSQLDRATQQNAALVEQSAAAADSLQRQAQALAEVVHKFRLEDVRGAFPQPSARPVEVLGRQERRRSVGAVQLPAP